MLKPLKATSKPPQRHILGIDSGIQSHPKATPKPPQGYPKATPRLHQGSTKATPKPHQSHTKATPKPPMPPESQLMRPVQGRRTPEPHAWISVEQGIDVSPLTPAPLPLN